MFTQPEHDGGTSNLSPVGSTPTDMNGARIFIADAHPLILDSFKGVFLSRDPSAKVVCFSAFAALKAALAGGAVADLVLLGLHMPGLDSVAAVRDFLAAHRPHCRVAVLSGHVDAGMTRDLIRVGCVGVIPKSLPLSAIYHAIRLMIDGRRVLPDCLAEVPLNSAAPVAAPVMPTPPAKYGLTRHEVEVLRCLATGGTNKQIGRKLKIEEVTVKLHLRRSYTKLGVRNRVEAVRAVFDGALDTDADQRNRSAVSAQSGRIRQPFFGYRQHAHLVGTQD